ncbi:MAG: L,D-transpeptidase family protein [Candidatus Woesearchaeota archaeon]
MDIRVEDEERPLTNAVRDMVNAYRVALGTAFGIAVLGIGANAVHTELTSSRLEKTIQAIPTQVRNDVIKIVDERVSPLERRVEALEQKNGMSPRLSDTGTVYFMTDPGNTEIPNSVDTVFRNAQGISCVVYADKIGKEVTIYTRQGELYRAPATFGTNPWPKTRQGDKATPEGIYRIVSADPNPGNPLYGSRKLTLDYPNSIDRSLHRSGNGILLCGTDYDSRERAIQTEQNASNGGIVVTNKDIERIYELIASRTEQTAVVIEDKGRPLFR